MAGGPAGQLGRRDREEPPRPGDAGGDQSVAVQRHHALDERTGVERVGRRDADHVAFYDKPFLKFERLLETYLAFAPKGFRSFRMALPLWLKEKLFQKSLLTDELKKFAPEFDREKLLFCEHHLSHAASAFYLSGHSAATTQAPRPQTGGRIEAEACIVCPGDDFTGLFPERLAAWRRRIIVTIKRGLILRQENPPKRG